MYRKRGKDGRLGEMGGRKGKEDGVGVGGDRERWGHRPGGSQHPEAPASPRPGERASFLSPSPPSCVLSPLPPHGREGLGRGEGSQRFEFGFALLLLFLFCSFFSKSLKHARVVQREDNAAFHLMPSRFSQLNPT